MGKTAQAKTTAPTSTTAPEELEPYAVGLEAAEAEAMLSQATTEDEVAQIIAANWAVAATLWTVVAARMGNAKAARVWDKVAKLMTKQLAEAGVPADHVDDAAVSALTGQTAGGAVEMQSKDLRAVKAGDPLPFTAAGWDGVTIATRLGQYDRIAGTDSDAVRCTYAVSLAARILAGPAAVVRYLEDFWDERHAAMAKTRPSRAAAAQSALAAVATAIADRTATFGDLGWAQEALHDLVLLDDQGSRGFEDALIASDQFTPIGSWCTSTGEIMKYAGKLADGEQLMCSFTDISWNAAFAGTMTDGDEQVGAGEPVDHASDQRMVSNGRAIKRIDTRHKPKHADFDADRDKPTLGHQFMIARVAGDLVVYNSEKTVTGKHLAAISKQDASALEDYLEDTPAIEHFRYVQVEGRLTTAPPRP